jgi:hypothetical protein
VGLDLVARSNEENGRARGVVTTWSPRAGRHSGVLAGVSVTVNRWQGAVSELVGATGWTPGTEEGAGVHQKRWVDDEATQEASGGGVQRRWGSSGGHQ